MLVEQVMGERKAYPSDLTDEQWAVVGPFRDAWKAKHPSVSGHQGRYSLREILNSMSIRTGLVVSGRICRMTCHRSPRRTTTSRRGVTMALTRRSMICCAARRGRKPADAAGVKPNPVHPAPEPRGRTDTNLPPALTSTCPTRLQTTCRSTAAAAARVERQVDVTARRQVDITGRRGATAGRRTVRHRRARHRLAG